MQIKNTEIEYGTITKWAHWLIAVAVISMLAIGFFASFIPKDIRGDFILFHKSLGLTILVFMVLRLIWRFINPRPQLPTLMPKWQKWTADFSHWLFYLLLIAMPISGWVMSVAAKKTPVFFGLFKVPLPIAPNKALGEFAFSIHEILAWVILSLIVIHILAAIKHQFLNKDNVLRRML